MNKAEFDSLLKSLKVNNKNGFPAKKFCGIMKIEKSPLEIQKELRSDW